MMPCIPTADVSLRQHIDLLENHIDVLEFLLTRWDIKNKRTMAHSKVAGYFANDLFIRTNEIRAKCLVGVERSHPIGAILTSWSFFLF